MQKIVQNWVDSLLVWLGIDPTHIAGVDQWIVLGIILLLVLLFDATLRLILMRGVRRIVQQTKVKWDDLLFSDRVLRRLSHIASPILVYVLLPVAFPADSEAFRILSRLTQIAIVVVFFQFVSALIYSAFCMMAQRPAWEGKPLKGLRQTGQGIALLICVILVISILINKSPAILLTGLGASAAIMMLIFKDSILGFVSGIQLSANDMLKVGDWITMPRYGADGTVEEVSLTTVKIRNFDNTMVTVPPYLLVSDSFQNWRAMQQSGGRRVKRSVNIDMTSVCFCTPEMLDRFRRSGLLKDYVDAKQQDIERYNAERGINSTETPFDGRHQTNLGIFRAYLVRYLNSEVRVNKGMTLMVRQLQPTETGLPMELYFFTDTVDWVTYEGIQSDVFDHVLAVIPEFGLRVFQSPTGTDVQLAAGELRGSASTPEMLGDASTAGESGNDEVAQPLPANALASTDGDEA